MTEFKVGAHINGTIEFFKLRVGGNVDLSDGLPDIKPLINAYAQGKYGPDVQVGNCSWGLA